MIGLCEVRCSDTNISSAIAAKPSRSTSSVKRSVLTCLPPTRALRMVAPEARKRCRGRLVLAAGPKGRAPAAWPGSPWMSTGDVSRPLLDDEIAQFVAADRLPGQDQRGCRRLL